MYDSEELLQDFIIEAKEHLQTIEPNIFRLEKEPEERPNILNEIFRPMHSLKGASGFLGLEKINSLAHKAESVMDELRKGTIEVTSSITDAILITTEILGKIVENLEEYGNEGDIDTTEISRTLQNILDRQTLESTTPMEKETPPNQNSATNPVTNILPILEKAVDAFLKEPDTKEHVESVLNALVSVAEDAEKAELEDIANSAKNTIEIIQKTQEKGADFSPLLSILEQELAIIIDLTKKISNDTSTEDEQYVHGLQEALNAFLKQPTLNETVNVLYDVLLITKEYASEYELNDIMTTASNTAEILKKTKDANDDITPLLPIISQEVSIIIELLNNHGKACAHTTENDTQEHSNQKEETIETPIKEHTAKTTSIQSDSKTVKKEENKSTQKESKDSDKIKQSAFIRVDHHKLDQLMNLIGELIITRNRYSLLVRSLEDEDKGAKEIATIAQNLTETTSSMARISDALQDTIMQVRMVSLATTFSRLPRLVRDISKKSGKEVELHVIGEETELDKNMVEALADPLLHLIRNAVDHGIETPQERIEHTKNPMGNVWIRAFHKGNSVVIEIEDDGKGMDPERLKEVAIEKGLLSPEEAKFVTNDQAFELIFLPGFSSAKEVTDISGRGVGMDVVRTNIKNLKGTISIHSVLGQGSTFTLSFPLTLAIIEALMVEVHSQIFAIPLDTVLETTKISKTHIKKVQDTEAITLRGEVLSIVHLADKLGLKKEHPMSDIISVVIVTINNKKVGLVVDKLLERQEIVIKSLGNYPIVNGGISGATITGDGGVILIINPHDLCTMPTRKS